MNLIEYVRKNLTEFVGIPSTPDTDMRAILRAATASIEELGLKPTSHADVKAVTASSGSGGILFNGHLDTVPIASGWTRELGSWDGDFLYGRGTADMKAGCVAGLAAARALLDAGIPVSLLFTTDEETTMHGAVKLAPSDLVKNAAAVVVAEPTRLRVVASEKGVLWYRASTSGRSAHGSLPHLGDNAVYRMMRFLARMERYGHPRDGADSCAGRTRRTLRSRAGRGDPDRVWDQAERRTEKFDPPPRGFEDVGRFGAPRGRPDGS